MFEREQLVTVPAAHVTYIYATMATESDLLATCDARTDWQQVRLEFASRGASASDYEALWRAAQRCDSTKLSGEAQLMIYTPRNAPYADRIVALPRHTDQLNYDQLVMMLRTCGAAATPEHYRTLRRAHEAQFFGSAIALDKDVLPFDVDNILAHAPAQLRRRACLRYEMALIELDAPPAAFAALHRKMLVYSYRA